MAWGQNEVSTGAGLTGLPYAEEPDPVEALGDDPVEIGVGESSRVAAECLTTLVQPRARVDLVERGMRRAAAAHAYWAVQPPSITSSLPVMKADSSEAR